MKTVRRPPYPKWNPGYFPCSSLTPPSAFLTPSIGVLRWIRAKGQMSRRLPNNHDVILGYQKTMVATWNTEATFQPYDENSLDHKTAAKYNLRDVDGRRYQLSDLTNPNPNRPNL